MHAVTYCSKDVICVEQEWQGVEDSTLYYTLNSLEFLADTSALEIIETTATVEVVLSNYGRAYHSASQRIPQIN